MRRRDTMRRCCHSLTERYGKLVVNPAMLGIPGPGVAVLSRNENVGRALHTLKILSAPRVDLANGHWNSYVEREKAVNSDCTTAAMQPAIVAGVAAGAEVPCLI